MRRRIVVAAKRRVADFAFGARPWLIGKPAVRRIDDDDLRQALAAGLQYFAFKTGCRLIAEGVESDGEADVLRRLGVEYGQGYLFGKPAVVAA